MAQKAGFDPATHGFSVRCSTKLSYFWNKVVAYLGLAPSTLRLSSARSTYDELVGHKFVFTR